MLRTFRASSSARDDAAEERNAAPRGAQLSCVQDFEEAGSAVLQLLHRPHALCALISKSIPKRVYETNLCNANEKPKLKPNFGSKFLLASAWVFFKQCSIVMSSLIVLKEEEVEQEGGPQQQRSVRAISGRREVDDESVNVRVELLD
jgi:hypothetical protein